MQNCKSISNGRNYISIGDAQEEKMSCAVDFLITIIKDMADNPDIKNRNGKLITIARIFGNLNSAEKMEVEKSCHEASKIIRKAKTYFEEYSLQLLESSISIQIDEGHREKIDTIIETRPDLVNRFILEKIRG